MIERFGQGLRYHDVVSWNGLLFLSGLTDTDAGNTMRQQAEGVLKKADAMLQAHGSDRDHILRAEVFVRDHADVATFNEVWDQWINRDTVPARYLAVSKLGREPILVYVVLTAAVRSLNSLKK